VRRGVRAPKIKEVILGADGEIVARPPKDPMKEEEARQGRLRRFAEVIPHYEALARQMWPPQVRLRRRR
jgi:hypothetical protein